jgi:hypothetical protein
MNNEDGAATREADRKPNDKHQAGKQQEHYRQRDHVWDSFPLTPELSGSINREAIDWSA